jgi:hypothetical protein
MASSLVQKIGIKSHVESLVIHEGACLAVGIIIGWDGYRQKG